jgi:disulfide bond formation protein DsbB
MLHSKNSFLVVLITALAALGVALFSQHMLDMAPCSWCILQRVLFVLIAAFALLGLLGSAFRRWRLLNWGLIVVTAFAGIAVAWHQITVAAKAFSCDQSFADRVISGSGLEALAPWLFGIYATCLDASVRVLGVDYAAWGLSLFLLYAVYGLVMLVTSWRSNERQMFKRRGRL